MKLVLHPLSFSSVVAFRRSAAENDPNGGRRRRAARKTPGHPGGGGGTRSSRALSRVRSEMSVNRRSVVLLESSLWPFRRFNGFWRRMGARRGRPELGTDLRLPLENRSRVLRTLEERTAKIRAAARAPEPNRKPRDAWRVWRFLISYAQTRLKAARVSCFKLKARQTFFAPSGFIVIMKRVGLCALGEGAGVVKEEKKARKRKKNKQVKKHQVPAEMAAEPELAKYWAQRYRLFSRFDEGIKLDRGQHHGTSLRVAWTWTRTWVWTWTRTDLGCGVFQRAGSL